MSLVPTTPKDSTYRLFYKGPVGVNGIGVQQSLDLTSLPTGIRQDPSFVNNWRVFVRQADIGITDVSPDVDFTFNPTGLPVAMVLTLSAANIANQIDIEAWYIHSVVR